MIKYLPVSGYQLGDAPVTMIKRSSRGLVGADRQSLIKRASEDFARQFDNVQLMPGDVAAHQIIIGSTELYGPNRNKDGFRKLACQQFHPTFVKHAKCYRNHQNRNPQKSYGYIKLSHYNPRMHRIELLAIYNGTKEAADRNGGLVADEEIEDLETRGDFPISMACNLPFDHCSHCGNAARRREEYCLGVDEGGQCKAGGLRNNIGAITTDPDNPVLHADNRERVVFFDSSRVPRQADMIAYALGITKSAAAIATRDGVSLAEACGAVAPLELEIQDETRSRLLKLARQAAAQEQRLGNRAFDLAVGFENDSAGDWLAPGISFSEKLAALSQVGVVMPVRGFLASVHGKAASEQVVERVRAAVPGAVARLLDDNTMFLDLFSSSLLFPQVKTSDAAKTWAMSKLSHNVSDRRSFQKRAAAAIIDGKSPQKPAMQACTDPAVDALAKIYVAYKLAFLSRFSEKEDLRLVTDLVISQN